MVDATDASFQIEVVEASKTTPVVVDLWAPWCEPCKSLGPIIEMVIAETQGRVKLVKVNVDENPQISAAFQVQSIPAVFAIVNGQVVDNFVGAKPEGDIRRFVAGLMPNEADVLASSDDEESLRAALQAEPGNVLATTKLAELEIGRGNPAEALELLAKVPETPEVAHLAALARLALNDVALGDTEVTARLDTLLESAASDEADRREFLDILESIGPHDPRTAPYRKALTAKLF
jgi:putative thioredoxin